MKMPLKDPFETSFGAIKDRSFLVVEAHGEGRIGYAEVVTEAMPLYNEECIGSTQHMLDTFLVPLLFQNRDRINHPSEISALFKPFKRNYLAKSGLESACWDLYGKINDTSLASLLSGERKEIEVGISIGIQENMDDLLQTIQNAVDQGYKRIKLKIKPGKDLEVVKRVREKFPVMPLMIDANSAYTLDDLHIFKQLDHYDLMMIEQPLAHDDIIDHSRLQQEIKTPICLDESIHNIEDVRKALTLGSCKIINIKIGRVGGLQEAKNIHDLCMKHQVPVWCGGMLEAGIGRAHNLAIASLPNFTIAGDTSPSSRYWYEDILLTPVEFSEPGKISVPFDQPGIGFEVDIEKLNRYTIDFKAIDVD